LRGKAFDQVARRLATGFSRRGLWGIATGAALGAVARLPITADAKKKRKRKKTPKLKLNAFGCVNVGGFCKNGGQCCSGICQGKKGKKKCQAHDASTCVVGQISTECGAAEDVACTTSSGGEGTCTTTTGNAAYCFADGDCFPCKKDADCQAFCGPQAACIPCVDDCAEGSACVGANDDDCGFPDA
jgi:hypothetical protein